LFSKVVIVGFDVTAVSGSGDQAGPANFIRLVERNVELEETSARSGEAILAHIGH
jgi:hypothetical protein